MYQHWKFQGGSRETRQNNGQPAVKPLLGRFVKLCIVSWLLQQSLSLIIGATSDVLLAECRLAMFLSTRLKILELDQATNVAAR